MFIDRCSVATMTQAGILVATPSRVVISDTTVRRTLFGPALHVTSEGASVDLLRSRIEGNAGGVVVDPVLGPAVTLHTTLLISDSVIARNFDVGVNIVPTGTDGTVKATVTRSVVEANTLDGIRGIAAGGSLTVTDSWVARNTGKGVHVSASAAGSWEMTVARSTIEDNGSDGISAGPGTGGAYRLVISDNVVRNNAASGIFLNVNAGESGSRALVANNHLVGNFFAGIRCSAPLITASASLIAERNGVLGNATGIPQEPGATSRPWATIPC